MHEYIECDADGLRHHVAVEALRMAVDDLNISPPPQLRFYRERRPGDSPDAAVVWQSHHPLAGFSDSEDVWLRYDLPTAHELAETIGHECWHYRGRHTRFASPAGGIPAELENAAASFGRRFAATSAMTACRRAHLAPHLFRVVHGMPYAVAFPPPAREPTRPGGPPARHDGAERRAPPGFVTPIRAAAAAMKRAARLITDLIADARE